jgi:hypothetical protein
MIAICALIVAVQAPQTPPALERFLRQSIGLDAGEIAGVERGEALVKVFDTEGTRDVALFGITTVDVPRDAYVRQARDFSNSLRTPTRSRFGIFSNPAALADVQAVTIAERDVKDMRDCKPGDCVVKLPAVDMQRIRQETNWSGADLQAQLSAYARRRLVEYVTDYRARGDSAMAIYDDRGNVNVRASEAFAALLAASPYVYQNVPSLGRYLASYPRGTLSNASEILFWSEDVLPRLRPILSVTHQVVYTPPELPEVTIVAAKQIYANHYFEAAIDLTCVVDRQRAGAPPGSYLLVLRRFRFDNLPRGILNIRGRAIGALRDQLLADLHRLKATAEQAGRGGR